VRIAATLEQCWHEVPGGSAVAALHLVRHMAEREDIVGVSARHRQGPPEAFTPPVPVRQLPLPRLAMYESWAWLRWPPVERATGSVDVVYATTVMFPAAKAPVVVALHDVAFLHEPAHFTSHGARIMRRHLKRIRDQAALVLCSSSATADDAAAFGIDRARLRVVLLGVEVIPTAAVDVGAARARYGLAGPYIAFLGTREPRKNLAGMLAALERLESTGLVLALMGPSGWGDDLSRAIERFGPRVRQLGYVSEPDKRALLAGADVFCYPSVREGFGLPVLEAMAQGTAVVTSKGTSTEEVAGDAAVLVDPNDPHSIADGIIEARARRAELAQAGGRRAGEFTWQRAATETLDALREVAT
jgi:glycosyltransferase involved in cell wall biosynthesis